MGLVFFSKCRPQGCDAIDLALRHNIIFFGYPLWREGIGYDPKTMHACLVDPSLEHEMWVQATQNLKTNIQQKLNRNLVLEINKILWEGQGVL
jgi:hypothetical protein